MPGPRRGAPQPGRLSGHVGSNDSARPASYILLRGLTASPLKLVLMSRNRAVLSLP